MSDEIPIPRKRSLIDPEPTDTLYIKGAPELIEFAERECARCGYPTRRLELTGSLSIGITYPPEMCQLVRDAAASMGKSPSAMLLRIFEEKLRASRQASPQSGTTSQ